MNKNAPYGFCHDPEVEGDYMTVLMELLPPEEERPKHSYDDIPSQKKGANFLLLDMFFIS